MEDLSEPVTIEQVRTEIDNYLSSVSNPSVSVKMILSKPLNLLENFNIEIPILNKVEISMVQSSEQELLNHLRKTLRNSYLHITYKVSEHQGERRPYTNTEIFAAMIKKNPILLKLRDELGLDTD